MGWTIYNSKGEPLSAQEQHALLGANHSDTLAAGVTDGSIVIGNATPKWSELVIAVPAANVRNVLGVDNAELRPSWKTALDGANPANIANAASPGTSLIFSHRDHIHAHPGALGANLHHNQSHAAADHNAAILTAGFNESLGAYYLDIGEIAVPANPGANVRRLFCDQATGELSVRTNAGATVSLEGAGGGGTLDSAYDFGGAGAGRIITADTGAVELRHNADTALLATRDSGGADTNDRFSVSRDGGLLWGTGAAAADVALTRVAANQLALAAGDSLRVQYLKDTAGNTRYTTAAAGTQNTITGQTIVTGRLGVRTSPPANDSIILNLQPTIVDAVGIFPTVFKVNPTFQTTVAWGNIAWAVEGIMTCRLTGGAMCSVFGLQYAVTPTSISSHVNSCPEASAVVASWNATRSAGTLNVTEASALKAVAPILTGTLTDINITRSYGLWMQNQGHARIATSYGIKIAAQSGSSTASYGIYIENAATYAIHVDAGLSRFDGDGTDVFELPADPTDPTSGGGAATGRIPVKIGGGTVYLAYY